MRNTENKEFVELLNSSDLKTTLNLRALVRNNENKEFVVLLNSSDLTMCLILVIKHVIHKLSELVGLYVN